MSEFRGARGSNTGDDFHELWATRHALRLLDPGENLRAITVEGLSAADEAGSPPYTWDGVDCALYFGGENAETAERLRIEQLKYSAADPTALWTVARLVAGQRREQSVIAKLARAWKALAARRPDASPPQAVLVSNQPVADEVIKAVARATTTPLPKRQRRPPADAPAEARLAYATGLSAEEFRAFAAALVFQGGAGSRFAVEERVLRAVSGWTDQDVQPLAMLLRQFVRQRMRPEFAGELITREALILGVLGTADGHAVFPCLPEIARTTKPVSRAAVRLARDRVLTGSQYLCLHGSGGAGKTTALQEIEAGLPAGSLMVTYDCYGQGRYLDPSALRHRGEDAFVQLTNEVAARLRLPLLVTRRPGADLPRQFANRLSHAAGALAAQDANALLVVAVDAADNSVAAAEHRARGETPFVHDFVQLRALPSNVRLLVTARTGRLEQLRLPRWFEAIEIEPFSRAETAENVARVWDASVPWLDDFHHLSGGVPRVQAYAFEVDGRPPSTALDRLRPSGKSLDAIFREQFGTALEKNGIEEQVASLCAGLVALPRPVPLSELAAVLALSKDLLTDICLDLAPGIRLQNGKAGFADEDFEAFVRAEGAVELPRVRQQAAAWLLSRARSDVYAALNVAAALAAAGRGAELLQLVEEEPAPAAVVDPVQRREAELHRLRLAMMVCREAGDAARALRFVLIGAEGVRAEAVVRDLLVENPDLAVRAAADTLGRLVLSDPELVPSHGRLLLQKLSADADRGDAISVREGWRLMRAWFQLRERESSKSEGGRRGGWAIQSSDILSSVEAAVKLDGPLGGLNAARSWRPKRVALDVALALPPRLVAMGRAADLEALVAGGNLGSGGAPFVLIPLALAGRAIDAGLLAAGLDRIRRRRLGLKEFFEGFQQGDEWSRHGGVLDTVLTACEVLTSRGAAASLVDEILDAVLVPGHRRIEARFPHEAVKLDLLFRAYALREARAGRKPEADGFFVPRPKPQGEGKRRTRGDECDEEHDRSLRELAGVVFPTYAVVALALANKPDDAQLDAELGAAVERLSDTGWRASRRESVGPLRRLAARASLVLLAAGHGPHMLMRHATAVHGHWRSGQGPPHEGVLVRLGLRQELHGALLEDLAAVAAETRGLRIGAGEKARTLVEVARQLLLVSAADAAQVFGAAVEAAAELDREAVAQLRLLEALVARGVEGFPDARATARLLSDVAADAAIRLDGEDAFAWRDAMAALARLEPALALANAARWDAEGLARLDELLPPLLKTTLQTGSVSPARAAALALLVDDDGGVLSQSLRQAELARDAQLATLAEEAARDVLMRPGDRRRADVARRVEAVGRHGTWVSTLRAQEGFVAALPVEPTPARSVTNQGREATVAPIAEREWPDSVLLDGAALQAAVADVRQRAHAEHRYPSVTEILEAARLHVPPARRSEYLTAIASFDDAEISTSVAEALLEAIAAWQSTPAVQAWCRASLPDVVVRWLPELALYLPHGRDHVTTALTLTGAAQAGARELVLRGIERHVDRLGSDVLFALAGLLGSRLAGVDAAGLADWYLHRLGERIPAADRDQVAPPATLPRTTDEAVARFLMACMADRDTRVRWRAAHAVRRLARAGDEAALDALMAEYGRREDPAFRGAAAGFFWLAARLWLVIACDRLAREQPALCKAVGPVLLEIALDDSFPHMLVRSFAKDACDKLVAASELTMTAEQAAQLGRVNETALPRAVRVRDMHHVEWDVFSPSASRRFRFDPMDTVPYWFKPMLRAFADVDMSRFLSEVERWIVDAWGYDSAVVEADWKKKRRRSTDREWAIGNHRHGSAPTIEDLRTHLEWHGMWCTAGELLKTAPLATRDGDGLDDWDQLSGRIARAKLSEPPLWSADLLVPTPLRPNYWGPDGRTVAEWANVVTESDHRSELLPADRTGYVVVAGYAEVRGGDRIETTHVSSALADPETAGALLRALQTMDDAWDYKLPDEGEDYHELEEAPYRLLGWLCRGRNDAGIDDKDPFRGYASMIALRPGRRVLDTCRLTRDEAGRPSWSGGDAHRPMFMYEAWGEEETDDRWRNGGFTVGGHRLLADAAQLLGFLRGQGLDLIVEVEVHRRGRENRRYVGQEDEETPEGRFDRLYRLGNGGSLAVAEGHLGAWAGDCPAT